MYTWTCKLGIFVLQVGQHCYKLVWPAEETGKPLNRSLHSMTVEQGRGLCNTQGGVLAKIESKEEMDNIRGHAVNSWWGTHLQYIPGPKLFFIGPQKNLVSC